MTDELRRLIAYKGTVTVNDTTKFDDEFIGIYFAEDTVIANLEVNNVAVDVTANYITTPATGVKGNVYKTVLVTDHFFSSITLTSGSVELILAGAV